MHAISRKDLEMCLVWELGYYRCDNMHAHCTERGRLEVGGVRWFGGEGTDECLGE